MFSAFTQNNKKKKKRGGRWGLPKELCILRYKYKYCSKAFPYDFTSVEDPTVVYANKTSKGLCGIYYVVLVSARQSLLHLCKSLLCIVFMLVISLKPCRPIIGFFFLFLFVVVVVCVESVQS